MSPRRRVHVAGAVWAAVGAGLAAGDAPRLAAVAITVSLLILIWSLDQVRAERDRKEPRP
jgi:uncharacterized membrane protein YhiD involved in acid resistance